MKHLKVDKESWFKLAPFHDVRMLGIKHLGIPAEKFETKQPEPFKRALVRQTFLQSHQYGEEFDIVEASNPFGVAKARTKGQSIELKGEYRTVKNGLRAPEGDIRHEMMDMIMAEQCFESLMNLGLERFGKSKYKSTGALEFDFRGVVLWALKRKWIERV